MHKMMRKAMSDEDCKDLKSLLKEAYVEGKSAQVVCSLHIRQAMLVETNFRNVKASLVLADNSTIIDAEIVDPPPELREEIAAGKIITTQWELIKSFKSAPMLRARATTRVIQEDFEIEDSFRDFIALVPFEKVDNQASFAQTIETPMKERVSFCNEIAESIHDPNIKRLYYAILALPGILHMPAAINNHHPEEGGYFRHGPMQIGKNLELLTKHRKWPDYFYDVFKIFPIAHDLEKLTEYQFDSGFAATQSTRGNFAPHIPRTLLWLIRWNRNQKPGEAIEAKAFRLLLDMVANHHGAIQMPSYPATPFAYDIQHGFHLSEAMAKDASWEAEAMHFRTPIREAAKYIFQHIPNGHFYPEFVNFALNYPILCDQGVYDAISEVQEAMLLGAMGLGLDGDVCIRSGQFGKEKLFSQANKFCEGMCRFVQFQFLIENVQLHHDPDKDLLIKELAANMVLSTDRLDGVELDDPQTDEDYARIYAQKADWMSFTHERHIFMRKHDFSNDVFPAKADFTLGGNRFLLKNKEENGGKDLFKDSLPVKHAFQSQEELDRQYKELNPKRDDPTVAESIKNKNFTHLH